MTATDPRLDGLSLNMETLPKEALSVIRVALGVVGFIALALGIALLVWPGATLSVLAALAAIYFVIAGIARLAVGIFAREAATGYRVLGIVLGILLILLGVVSLRNLDQATAILTVLVAVMVGVGWIIEGIFTLVEAGRAKGAGLAVAAGVLSIVAGVVVLVVPVWSVFAFVMVTGMLLIVLGAISVVRTFKLGRPRATA